MTLKSVKYLYLSTVQKLLCKIPARRISLAAESAGLIRQEQLGFRAGEECLTQAAALIEILQRWKNAGKETYLCFLDLKKAYDMVSHRRLLYKLRTAGLGEKMTNCIE